MEHGGQQGVVRCVCVVARVCTCVCFSCACECLCVHTQSCVCVCVTCGSVWLCGCEFRDGRELADLTAEGRIVVNNVEQRE